MRFWALYRLPVHKCCSKGSLDSGVTDSGGELGVGWLTSGYEEGVLEGFLEGRSVYRVETPLAQAHFMAFARLSGDSVLLRYGALRAEDLYATVLYLREEVP